MASAQDGEGRPLPLTCRWRRRIGRHLSGSLRARFSMGQCHFLTMGISKHYQGGYENGDGALMALGITHILGGSSSEVLNTKGPEVLVTLVDGRCHRLQPAGLPSEVHIQLKYLASLLPCGSSKLFQHQCGSFSVRPSGRVISADFGRSESCNRGRNMPQLMLYLSGLSADFFPKVCRNGFLLFDVPKCLIACVASCCQGTMPQLMMWVGPSLDFERSVRPLELDLLFF